MKICGYRAELIEGDSWWESSLLGIKLMSTVDICTVITDDINKNIKCFKSQRSFKKLLVKKKRSPHIIVSVFFHSQFLKCLRERE